MASLSSAHCTIFWSKCPLPGQPCRPLPPFLFDFWITVKCSCAGGSAGRVQQLFYMGTEAWNLEPEVYERNLAVMDISVYS